MTIYALALAERTRPKIGCKTVGDGNWRNNNTGVHDLLLGA